MSEFKDYVTSSAFTLVLSEPMIQMLIEIEYTEANRRQYIGTDATIMALKRRGLVDWPVGRKWGGIHTTSAGVSIARLLISENVAQYPWLNRKRA